MYVSCCNFSGLLLGTTPWEFYVCELVVQVKNYKSNKLIYIDSKENPYRVLEQNRASDQALNNTSQSSQGHQWKRLRTGHILEHPISSPKQSGVLQEQEEHARVMVASRRGSISLVFNLLALRLAGNVFTAWFSCVGLLCLWLSLNLTLRFVDPWWDPFGERSSSDRHSGVVSRILVFAI